MRVYSEVARIYHALPFTATQKKRRHRWRLFRVRLSALAAADETLSLDQLQRSAAQTCGSHWSHSWREHRHPGYRSGKQWQQSQLQADQ